MGELRTSVPKDDSLEMDNSSPFSRKVKDIIREIPPGKVATYGQIAAYAGNPLAARQVVRVLHTSSDKDRLPWHRIINRRGKISLRPGQGYEMQLALLEKEGIEFGPGDIIDLKKYLWNRDS